MAVAEPWYCQGCKHLVYNLDESGYPTEGAPAPHFWSTTYQKLCRTCYQMAVMANTEYMRDVTQALARRTKERS